MTVRMVRDDNRALLLGGGALRRRTIREAFPGAQDTTLGLITDLFRQAGGTVAPFEEQTNWIRSRKQGLPAKMARDMMLMKASRRWEPGGPDPVAYRPIDVPALRLVPARPLVEHLGDGRYGMEDNWVEVTAPLMAYEATPFFLDDEALNALLATDLPSEEVFGEEDIEAPFTICMVVFPREVSFAELGAPFDREPSSEHDPMPPWSFFRTSVVDAMAERGGALTGVVIAMQHGHPLDWVTWMISAEPDSSLPHPFDQDRQRGYEMGLLSLSKLCRFVWALALLIDNAAWTALPTDIPTIGQEGSPRWERSLFRHKAQQALQRGAGTGVRVIDMQATRKANRASHEPTGAHVAPHWCRGHWHRYRVSIPGASGGVHGTQGKDWRYVTKWVLPYHVGNGEPANITVYRLPKSGIRSGGATVAPH